MKRWILILMMMLGTSLIQAQHKIVITGIVTEEPDNSTNPQNRPVKDVSIYPENNKEKTVLSNRLGRYYITLTVNEDQDPPVLVFRSMLHDIYKRPLKKSEIRKHLDDTLKLDVVLNFITLPTVEVSAAPLVVFGSEELSVSDYLFHGDNFIMLAYEKRLDKGSKILYTNPANVILSSFTIPDVAKELYVDYAGRSYVICEKKVYEINVRDDVLSLFPLEQDFFETRIRPWVDTTETTAYFSNHLWYYPEFDYYAYDVNDSVFKKLRTVIDKPLMELYRAQYKYVDGRDKLEAYRAQLATGVDKEIWIAIWSGFPNSIYYHSLYAPMFIQNDTILIFDHYSNKLFRYNKNHEVLDSLDITYHIGPDKKQWEELLVKDIESQVIYSVFLKEGRFFLKELNTATGEIKNVFRLSYKYPERLKIRNGYAYYVYRPFESAQKKFLYKEKIGE